MSHYPAILELLRECDQRPYSLTIGMHVSGGLPFDSRLEAAIRLELADFVDKVFVVGGYATRLGTFAIRSWLLRDCIKNGADETVSKIFHFLHSNEYQFLEVLCLSGVRLPKSFSLTDTVKLYPIELLPVSKARDAFVSAKKEYEERYIRQQHEWGIGGYASQLLQPPALPTAALIKTHFVKQLFYDDFPERSFIHDDFDDGRSLDSYRSLLSLLGDAAPVARAGWTQLPDDSPFALDIGGGSFHAAFAETLPDYDLTEADMERASELSRRLEAMSALHWRRLGVAFNRLGMSKRRLTYEDKALDLGIALESMLLPNDSKELISYRIKLNGANFLGRSLDEKKDIFKTLGELYTKRSTAAHGSEFKGKINDSFVDLMKRGTKLSAMVLIKLMYLDEMPAWDEVAMGH